MTSPCIENIRCVCLDPFIHNTLRRITKIADSLLHADVMLDIVFNGIFPFFDGVW